LQAGRLPDAAAALEGRFDSGTPQIGGIIDRGWGGVWAAQGSLATTRRPRRGDICRIMLGATARTCDGRLPGLASYATAQGDVVEAHRMVCALGDGERLNLLPCSRTSRIRCRADADRPARSDDEFG